MAPTTIRTPPAIADFKPLEEHLQQTPESFFGGKPVLYYHATGAKAWIPKSQRGKLPFFPADLEAAPTAPEGAALSEGSEVTVEQKVDLYVNSQNLTIFSPSAEVGFEIPYPVISIHAIKTIGTGETKYPSVFLQLELSPDGGADDDDFETVELTLIPPTPTPAAPSSTEATTETEAAEPEPTIGKKQPDNEATKLYKAISACSDLNPDPVEEGDEDDEYDDDRIVFEGDAIEGFQGVFAGSSSGGLPPPMPGSGGWITAENVHEYFDADGNWIGGDEMVEEGEEEAGVSEELGEGAGTVRRREDVEDEAAGGEGGEKDEQGESKRARID
ncbi:regulator of volume decrease after cellular swelling-domain-containing protein [Sordaria brevicollis]|uniref:Regulator of volume decrease after cellular swelling-domain-containing protein n=1 Tax=Sordaria brevicollis TaxID=83679 RepID=A0AAE0PN69_SORBR|nr:regulator of volume decrease after cellular swelling-domain-containing protein [Sordaria brevicollis]